MVEFIEVHHEGKLRLVNIDHVQAIAENTKDGKAQIWFDTSGDYMDVDESLPVVLNQLQQARIRQSKDINEISNILFAIKKEVEH